MNIPVWHSRPVTVTAVVFNVIVVLLYGGDVKYIGCVLCTLGFSVKSNEMMIFSLCTFGISDLIANTEKKRCPFIKMCAFEFTLFKFLR